MDYVKDVLTDRLGLDTRPCVLDHILVRRAVFLKTPSPPAPRTRCAYSQRCTAAAGPARSQHRARVDARDFVVHDRHPGGEYLQGVTDGRRLDGVSPHKGSSILRSVGRASKQGRRC